MTFFAALYEKPIFYKTKTVIYIYIDIYIIYIYIIDIVAQKYPKTIVRLLIFWLVHIYIIYIYIYITYIIHI